MNYNPQKYTCEELSPLLRKALVLQDVSINDALAERILLTISSLLNTHNKFSLADAAIIDETISDKYYNNENKN